MTNLALPGNPRYQPKALVAYFGYDNLIKTVVEVEIATLKSLGEIAFIPAADLALLTPEVETALLAITTTEVDKIEREITKHDVRALVRRMQEILPEPLRRWVHVPLTSYDALDTARAVQFARVHREVVRPSVHTIVDEFRRQALKYAATVQIGRTHGQHALPITVGFWLSTILSRILFNASKMDEYADGLPGKISGAVGAYNAQYGLGMFEDGLGCTFEERVLTKLGLKPAAISTQILPPEPLAYYLYSALMLSAAIGQFGRDGRHLMRTEVSELAEPFDAGQVGSSTMAHKRNPITFENLEGQWLRTKNEFGKVLETLVSEHQRDLVGSSLARDFPIIIVNLINQFSTLLRATKGEAFIGRIVVDLESCKRNLEKQGDSILAEPLYIALQMAGYGGDAHEVVNHQAMPLMREYNVPLMAAISIVAGQDPALATALGNIPDETKRLLANPANYTGQAQAKTRQICRMAENYVLRSM